MKGLLSCNFYQNITLFPTVIVKMWVPSSLEAQSNITVCLGAMALGAFPIALIYFFTPSNVDKLGTDIKPENLVRKKNVITTNIALYFSQKMSQNMKSMKGDALKI